MQVASSILYVAHLLWLQAGGRGHLERVPSQSAVAREILEHRIPKLGPIQFQPT